MEQYPDPIFYNEYDFLLKIQSITYNVMFNFLPYDLKITESLTPEWNQESVIGRMDSIVTFKRMTRSMTATFKVRSTYGDKSTSLFQASIDAKTKEIQNVANTDRTKPYLPVDDLLHAIDHVKKCLYPRYNSNQILTSPPLFRIKYANLIQAGEHTDENGVLCVITSFSANPVMEVNKVAYRVAGPDQSSVKGKLDLAAYPKIFDISIGFTILNEQLVQQQVEGILNKRYFYNYSTDIGPRGGHESSSGHNVPAQQDTKNNTDNTDPEQNANTEATLKGGS